jgi:xanthine dehydrogenase small subunit
MTETIFLLNRSVVRETVALATPMLDLIREQHHLTSSKPVCREGDCGACLVLRGRLKGEIVAYQPLVSCLLPLAAVSGCHIVTLEGLNGAELNPIQQALVDEGAIQCGYCTPGLVLALTAFFLRGTHSKIDDALDAVAGQLCRCTGYSGIKRAVLRLCRTYDLAASPADMRLRDCVSWGILPEYFLDVHQRLQALAVGEVLSTQRLSEHRVIVGGGTDLWVHDARRFEAEALYLQSQLADSATVTLQCDRCRIDGRATLAQLGASTILQNILPSLSDDMRLVASEPIRQIATVAGNLANASPIADIAVMLLGLDAQLTLIRGNGERTLSMREFFVAYKQTALQPAEIIEAADLEYPAGLLFSFEKVCKRQHLDIASVNSALSIVVDDGIIQRSHLAFGGVAPIPLYCEQVCTYLTGKRLTVAVVVEAAKRAQQEVQPISDLRGSAAYKRLLVRQLVYAHFLKLFPDIIAWEALHAAD